MSLSTAFVSGGFPVLGAVFMFAAIMKVRALQSLELTLVRTMPRWMWASAVFSSRRLAGSVIALEFLTAVALLSAPLGARWYVAAWACVVSMCLCLVAVRAAQRRTPCGCFGGTAKAAGKIEVARAGTVLAVSVTLLSLTASGDVGTHFPTLSNGGLAAAILILAVLFLPTMAARTIRRTAAATRESTSEHPSRRAVLRGAVALAAFVGLAAFDRSTAFAGKYYRTCQDQYNLCYGCNPLQNGCCIECYVTCVGGGSCTPRVSCGGCWPDPYITYP